ncbi:MAG: hypothetical protein ABR878_03700 [Roseiarcus sp.]|jgi:methionine synthase I (cobalamin-dependent)
MFRTLLAHGAVGTDLFKAGPTAGGNSAMRDETRPDAIRARRRRFAAEPPLRARRRGQGAK